MRKGGGRGRRYWLLGNLGHTDQCCGPAPQNKPGGLLQLPSNIAACRPGTKTFQGREVSDGCLAAKCSIILLPARSSVAQGLPDDQPAIGQQFPGAGVLCQNGNICAKAIHPRNKGGNFPQPWVEMAGVDGQMWPWKSSSWL